MHSSSEHKLLICTNYRANKHHPSCGAKGSFKILDKLKAATHLNIVIEESPCMGRCQQGPNLHLAPNGPWLNQLKTDDAAIEHLIKLIQTSSS